jgi:hypothetical protein
MPPFFFRLKVSKNCKVRKENLYVNITDYELTTLELDLQKSIVSIWVEFTRNGVFIVRRKYDFGQQGDIDVNGLIKELHDRIENES